MAEQLDEKELVTFKEMLMANSIQVDAVAQLFKNNRCQAYTVDTYALLTK